MKLITTKMALLVGAAIIALPSAAQADPVGEARDMASFSKVTLLGSTDVEITVGPKQSVEVFAEADELEEIKTEIKDGALVIRRKSKQRLISFGHQARVVVTMPNLDALTSKGSGDATVEGLKAKAFKLKQAGSGDVDLSGSCDSAKMRSAGSGDFMSASLNCGVVELSTSGSGDFNLEVLVTKELTYASMGSGDLDVSGTCDTFDMKSSGSGDVDAKEFVCKDVDVDINGSGEVEIFASETVTVDISGSGDVDLYGGGKIDDLSTRGSGDVHTHK